MTEETTAPEEQSVFFTRQPIFDARRSIWGYELLGCEIKDGIHPVFPGQGGGTVWSAGTYVGLQEAMERGKKIMVGFDKAGILAGLPYALPPSSGVVRVLPGPTPASELDGALRKLRSDGYRIAVEILPRSPLPVHLMAQADILAWDLGRSTPESALFHGIKEHKGNLLARGVKTGEQFQAARHMDFTLFQGSFFKESERVPNRRLGSNEVTRLNLFRLMEGVDPDFKALAAAVRSDVSLSFRLLSYLNSASFGFRQNIQSIDQAVLLLGWQKLKSWLRAVLLVDMAGKDEVPRELAALSLLRGKFLEVLATRVDYWGFNPGTLFLMGLFSLLDAILGMPMEKVVELLPLDARLKAALQREPNNEYRPLFELLEHLEDADWPALEVLAKNLCVDLQLLKNVFAQAREWSLGFFAQGA
ncbi:MAG TPA: HDOD domain-containing protein [Syntrophobacteraceae bacterium]|nr:HDOD domain-containing protein [Syntrophobacteraceae bacterium]